MVDESSFTFHVERNLLDGEKGVFENNVYTLVSSAKEAPALKYQKGLKSHCQDLFEIRPGSVFHIAHDVISAHLISLLWCSWILKPSQFWEELTLADVILCHLGGVVEEPPGWGTPGREGEEHGRAIAIMTQCNTQWRQWILEFIEQGLTSWGWNPLKAPKWHYNFCLVFFFLQSWSSDYPHHPCWNSISYHGKGNILRRQ